MIQKARTLLVLGAVLCLPVLGSCDSGSSSTECGPGTILEDGVCVLGTGSTTGVSAEESSGTSSTAGQTGGEETTDTSAGGDTSSGQGPSDTTDPSGEATASSSDGGRVPTCDDGEQNQGEDDVDCGGPCPSCGPCDAPGSRAFLTSQTYEGDFTAVVGGEDGILGADMICQLHADMAGLGGDWGAWISGTDSDAIDRVEDVGPWHLLDSCGQLFASKAAITFSGPERPFNVDENGAEVHPAESRMWSGTDRFGRFNGFSCDGWTVGGPITEGGTGSPYFDWDHEEYWTDNVTSPCAIEARLLCLER